MKRIREGQPFSVIIDRADCPDRLERAFRRIKKILPKGRKIFGVICPARQENQPDERLTAITEKYCDNIYTAPLVCSRESRLYMIETVFRQADFGDCVLILGREDCSEAGELARQLAYEMDLL